MRIFITGGHLTPALATIEELEKKAQTENQPLQIFFVGRKHPIEGDPTLSVEYQTIKDRGIPFLAIIAGRLQRKFTRYTIPSLLKVPVGLFQALWWVEKLRPDIILSFGGYVALPVVVAGWLFHVPVVTHEQTVVSGLANKIISLLAKKICISWPESSAHFAKQKVILTGNPIRKEIFELTSKSNFHLTGDGPVVYITGGSLGSHTINNAVAQCLIHLLEKYIVIHQCGDSQQFRDFGKLESQKEKLPKDLQERYFLIKYIGSDDIGWVLKKADLVVSRAGANTVMELAALGKPAILIPIPWASANEQLKNAQFLSKSGGVVILPQEKLTGVELEHQIIAIMDNLQSYQKKAQEAKKLVNLDAAQKIVEILSETAKS